MFGMLGDITKAVVGVAIETPVALVADVVTMGGAINERPEPYTASAIKNVVKNIENATKPENK